MSDCRRPPRDPAPLAVSPEAAEALSRLYAGLAAMGQEWARQMRPLAEALGRASAEIGRLGEQLQRALAQAGQAVPARDEARWRPGDPEL